MAFISVVGLGKLGAPLAAVLAVNGHNVVGVDEVHANVHAVNSGKAAVKEHGLQELMDLAVKEKRICATKDYQEAVLATDVTFVIVPTSSTPEQPRFSNADVIRAVSRIGKALQKKDSWHLVVIVSTVMPGATDGVIREALEKAYEAPLGDKVGLCYSPEFIALGSVVKDMQNPDIILIGESDALSGDALEAILKSTAKSDPSIHRMSLVDAEIAKLSINTYVTMKITWANCLAEICEEIPGADARVVAKAVGADSRVGSKYIQPATAFGGPCFPRDTKAFFAMGLDSQVIAHLAEVTDRINDRQITRLALNIVSLNPGDRVGILGLAYKADTYITECSAGVRLVNELTSLGKEVLAYDPQVKGFKYQVDTLLELLASSDTIAIMTPWEEFASILPSSLKDKTVFDCWDVLSNAPMEDVTVFKVGKYHS